jgi:L-alanine-DL-glutamate epimerase-like enolase superfamily enzyme
MSKSTDVRINQVVASTQRIGYRTPMKFGGRVVTDAVLMHVIADVETADGRQGRGYGSMPLGNVWGWPSAVVSSDATLAAMTELGVRIAHEASNYSEAGHPLEIVHDLSSNYDSLAQGVTDKLALAEAMPRLAQLVAASPVDAAIHDAYGRALEKNAYDLLGPDYVNRDLSHYLTADFKGEYLDAYTLRQPKSRMPLYHLVGALDPLSPDDVDERLNDGLPETLDEWIVADGDRACCGQRELRVVAAARGETGHQIVADEPMGREVQDARAS